MMPSPQKTAILFLYGYPLRSALAEIQRAQDASADLTLFVNLEPCSHHCQTPPCVDAILCSPVLRVVAAMGDPNPQVAGSGMARLRASGVQVDVGCLGREAAELNHVFVARHLRRRPFVALKVALSADGCIAGAGGEPARITGDTARAHTHWLRAGLDAILVGVETLRRDRPRLDRRLYHGPGRNPRRLVLDPTAAKTDLRVEAPAETRTKIMARSGQSRMMLLRPAH